MKPSDILFCIFNYKDNENAEFLYRVISPTFRCRIIDCDSGVRPNLFDGDTVCLPNVFYGGMLDTAVDLAREGDYEYMFLITSDVRITKGNIDKLLYILQTEDFSRVGVYSPSHQADSYTNPLQGYCQHTNKRRRVPFVEGMMSMYKREIYEKTYPCKHNPHGWGPDVVACFFANQWNLRCEIDDRVQIYHPKGDTKKGELAHEQCMGYYAQFVEKEQILRWHQLVFQYREIPSVQSALWQIDFQRALSRQLNWEKICRLPRRIENWMLRKFSKLGQ